VRASEPSWIEFKKSLIWQDMVESMQEELRLLQIDMEDRTATLDDLRFTQGKIFVIRHFLAFPDTAIITIGMEKEDAERQAKQTKEE
jgi:hypothetical protein